jgi:hypothetical protein
VRDEQDAEYSSNVGNVVLPPAGSACNGTGLSIIVFLLISFFEQEGLWQSGIAMMLASYLTQSGDSIEEHVVKGLRDSCAVSGRVSVCLSVCRVLHADTRLRDHPAHRGITEASMFPLHASCQWQARQIEPGDGIGCSSSRCSLGADLGSQRSVTWRPTLPSNTTKPARFSLLKHEKSNGRLPPMVGPGSFGMLSVAAAWIHW